MAKPSVGPHGRLPSISRRDTFDPIILPLSRCQEQTQFLETAARGGECTQITVRVAGPHRLKPKCLGTAFHNQLSQGFPIILRVKSHLNDSQCKDSLHVTKLVLLPSRCT